MKRLWGFAFLMAFVASGCGAPPTGTLSGKVTVNGKPLPAGMLILNTEDKMSFTTGIKDGIYSVDKIPLGKATIAVRESPAASNTEPGKGDPSKPLPPPPPKVVPAKYEKAESSGLSTTVVKGPNEFNIDLK